MQQHFECSRHVKSIRTLDRDYSLHHHDGGGGFFLACDDFGTMFDNSFPVCAFVFLFLIKWRLARAHVFHSLGQDQSTVAQRSETTIDRVFPDELRVSSFPGRFPHSAWTAASSAHSDFDGSRVYACLSVTCRLHFWQNDRGLLRATAVTRGWNGHRIRVSTQS